MLHKKCEIDETEVKRTYLYGDKNFQFIDAEEDGYRLGYIQRKVSRPYSIINTMTEGMVEDFFLTSSLKKPQYYNLLINNIL